MPIGSIYDAARAGMTYERQRLDAASRNIADANVPIAPGQQATRWSAAAPADFALSAGVDTGVGTQPASYREVHDPGHPLADEHGNVRYPATDPVQEMTTLMTASRGYEANVKAFNLLRSMTLHALEIGAK
jgi:flagellar basal-body rod protein FlgC